jgi:hypothetical protein
VNRRDPHETAAAIFRERYDGADSLLLAGSVTRGEATASSDLDLVVLYPVLERSFRESFIHSGWPVEVFAHDRETIEYYFIEKDLESGVGAMMWMVHDGIPVPGPTELNERVKARAEALLKAGPTPWSAADTDYWRYTITGLLDDLAEPRNAGESRAIVTTLHHLLGNFALRTRGLWGATGKTIPRRLYAADEALALKFDAAFAAAFRGDVAALTAVSDAVLAPAGGRLFEGYSSYSDADWRRVAPDGSKP